MDRAGCERFHCGRDSTESPALRLVADGPTTPVARTQSGVALDL